MAPKQGAPAAAEVPKSCPTDAPVVTETKEQLQQAVERVTTFPTTLDPRIFNNVTEVFDGQMRPDVREVSAGRSRRRMWVAWMASCPGACKLCVHLGVCNSSCTVCAPGLPPTLRRRQQSR